MAQMHRIECKLCRGPIRPRELHQCSKYRPELADDIRASDYETDLARTNRIIRSLPDVPGTYGIKACPWCNKEYVNLYGRRTLQHHILTKHPEKLIPTQKGDLVEQKRKLEEQIGHLLNQLVGLSKFPDEDPCQDGDVIWFEKKFPGGEESYAYAAIKSKGHWYTTGRGGGNFHNNWEELCAWMGRGVDRVYLMFKSEAPIIDARTSRSEFFAEMRRQLFSQPEDPDANWARGE